MLKVIVNFKRRVDMRLADFEAHWVTRHAALAP